MEEESGSRYRSQSGEEGRRACDFGRADSASRVSGPAKIIIIYLTAIDENRRQESYAALLYDALLGGNIKPISEGQQKIVADRSGIKFTDNFVLQRIVFLFFICLSHSPRQRSTIRF